MKKLLEKTGATLSDNFATRDRDFMEYTQTLNAQEASKVHNFVMSTAQGGDERTLSNNYRTYSTPNITMSRKNINIDQQSPSVLLPPSTLPKGIPVRSNQLYLKPGIIESRVAESPEAFSRLGEGFKKLFVDTTTASSQATMAFGVKSHLTSGSPKPIVIPIAGYTGHKKGENAENLFGRCFRDVAIKSKIIERGGLQK